MYKYRKVLFNLGIAAGAIIMAVFSVFDLQDKEDKNNTGGA